MKNIILIIARFILKFDFIIMPVVMAVISIIIGVNMYIALGVALVVFAIYASGIVHKFMATFFGLDIYAIIDEIDAELKK